MEEKIKLTVELYNRQAGEEIREMVTLPTHQFVLEEILKRFPPTRGKKYYSIFPKKSNCGLKMNDQDIRYTGGKSCYSDVIELNNILLRLNSLVTPDELKAIIEANDTNIYGNSSLKNLLFEVQEGRYHFYHNKTIDDIIQGLAGRHIYDDNKNELPLTEETLEKLGYKQTSTGVYLMIFYD